MYTALGIISVLLWSSTMAFSRSLTEQLGAMTAGACIYLVSGGLGCTYLVARGKLGQVRRMPLIYLLGCGGLLVVYMALIYMAIGLAPTRRVVIGVGIINYLWPGLTLIFSVPILKKRAGPLLVPGALAFFLGVMLASSQGGGLSPVEFFKDLGSSKAPYLLALAAAVFWALYSDLRRRWASESEGGAVPVFLLAAGVLLFLLRHFFPHEQVWTARTFYEMSYVALLPALLAYVFWDYSMRRGNLVLVASVGYLAPVLSTTCTSLYLHVRPGASLWFACGLVVAGAVICKLSVTDPPEEVAADGAEPATET